MVLLGSVNNHSGPWASHRQTINRYCMWGCLSRAFRNFSCEQGLHVANVSLQLCLICQGCKQRLSISGFKLLTCEALRPGYLEGLLSLRCTPHKHNLPCFRYHKYRRQLSGVGLFLRWSWHFWTPRICRHTETQGRWLCHYLPGTQWLEWETLAPKPSSTWDGLWLTGQIRSLGCRLLTPAFEFAIGRIC